MSQLLLTVEPKAYQSMAHAFSHQLYAGLETPQPNPNWPFAQTPTFERYPGTLGTVRVFTADRNYPPQGINSRYQWLSFWTLARIQGTGIGADNPAQYRFLLALDPQEPALLKYLEASFFNPLQIQPQVTPYEPAKGKVFEFELAHITLLEHQMRQGVTYVNYQPNQWQAYAGGKILSN